MTVQTFMCDRIVQTGKLIVHWVEVMPAERREWIPEIVGSVQNRSVNDILGELIAVNRLVTNALTGGEPPAMHPMVAPRPFTNVSEALPMFVATLDEAIAELITIEDSELEQEICVGTRRMRPIDFFEIIYRNLWYHGGQLNLLQLQYGDDTFHVLKG